MAEGLLGSVPVLDFTTTLGNIAVYLSLGITELAIRWFWKIKSIDLFFTH